jgi:hypothetical protein
VIIADAMPHDGWMTIGGLALFSIGWMLTLVPLGKALLVGRVGSRIAAAHGIAWVGLIASAIWITRLSTNGAKDVLFIMALLVSIGAVEGAVLWFGHALIKARDRASEKPAIEPRPKAQRPLESSPAPTESSSGPGLFTMAIAVGAARLFHTEKHHNHRGQQRDSRRARRGVKNPDSAHRRWFHRLYHRHHPSCSGQRHADDEGRS